MKTFLEIKFFSWNSMDFLKKTWNIVERNTFHTNKICWIQIKYVGKKSEKKVKNQMHIIFYKDLHLFSSFKCSKIYGFF